MVRLFVSTMAMALIATAGLAQDKTIPGQSPPAKQAAPAQPSDAQGHDAQAGRPETGEGTAGQAGSSVGTTGQAGGKTSSDEKNSPSKTAPSK